MSFDLKAFQKAQIEPRTREVPVPALAEFFGDGEEPVFKVRALDHAEVSRSRQCTQQDAKIKAAITALSGSDLEKAKAIQQIIGDVEGIPGRTRVRIEMLKMGCVEPKLDQQIVVRIGQFFPSVLEYLTDVIVDLTDQGGEIAKKKPKTSGTTQT